MHFGACIAILLLISGCAATEPITKEPAAHGPRLANLQRAAALPWRDGGRCVVREASRPWPVLVERCYQALDHDRVEFHDNTGRCAVASTGAAAVGLGFCVLAAPEIKEELDAYELRHLYPEEAGTSRGTMVASRDAVAKRKPELEPEPAGKDWPPPMPPMPVDRTRRASCEPVPVPHAGEDNAHNECADKFPPNRYPGNDVLVNGKRFDALQVGVRVLWEIKTYQFDTYSDYLRERVIEQQVEEFQEDRNIAEACGYRFVVGVSSAAHKEALIRLDSSLQIVVTGCKR
ncbi:hypothetical protein HMI50_08770 [Corallococcus carmarthensis]|nr:hypothetical protein [Corallococcus carmarthensis]